MALDVYHTNSKKHKANTIKIQSYIIGKRNIIGGIISIDESGIEQFETGHFFVLTRSK